MLVALCYAAGFRGIYREQAAFASQVAAARLRSAQVQAVDCAQLTDACRVAAAEIVPRLPQSCRAIVREPFVLAGDFEVERLDKFHNEALVPLMRALWLAYFDRRPDRPIVLVLLSGEQSYRDAAEKLDRYVPLAYAGYYQRSERRIVLNLETGYGTLAHELAHALAQFDFPEMPEWFDEGLASLHEDTRFSVDEMTLIGLNNWRCRLLPAAIRSGELPTLASLIERQSFRGEGEGLNYAQVRCFCRYLQKRGLLSHYYRKFRNNVQNDPSGLDTLRELLGEEQFQHIDRDFRTWVLQEDWD